LPSSRWIASLAAADGEEGEVGLDEVEHAM